MKQIENACVDQRVHYCILAAEESGLESHSIDLITVGPALHWFDLSKFWTEAKRVLKPQSVVAVWRYNVLSVAPEIDRITGRFYRGNGRTVLAAGTRDYRSGLSHNRLSIL